MCTKTQIMNHINKSDSPTTSEKLADLIGVTNKTIRNRLGELVREGKILVDFYYQFNRAGRKCYGYLKNTVSTKRYLKNVGAYATKMRKTKEWLFLRDTMFANRNENYIHRYNDERNLSFLGKMV